VLHKERTIEMGGILSAIWGRVSAIPATALVTETAGVSIPSLITSAVPKRVWTQCLVAASGLGAIGHVTYPS
jgi:hypothetical protein